MPYILIISYTLSKHGLDVWLTICGFMCSVDAYFFVFHEWFICKGVRSTGRVKRYRKRARMERNCSMDQVRGRRARRYGQMGSSTRCFVELSFVVEREKVFGIRYVVNDIHQKHPMKIIAIILKAWFYWTWRKKIYPVLFTGWSNRWRSKNWSTKRTKLQSWD